MKKNFKQDSRLSHKRYKIRRIFISSEITFLILKTIQILISIDVLLIKAEFQASLENNIGLIVFLICFWNYEQNMEILSRSFGVDRRN